MAARDAVSPRSAVASARPPAAHARSSGGRSSGGGRLGRRTKDGGGGDAGGGGGYGGGSGGGLDCRDDDADNDNEKQSGGAQQQQRHLHGEQQQQQPRSVGRSRSPRIGVGFSSDESEGEAGGPRHPVSPFPSITHPAPPPRSPPPPPRYQHSQNSPLLAARKAVLNNGLKRDGLQFKTPALPSPNGRGAKLLLVQLPAHSERSQGGGGNGNSSSSSSEGYSASEGEHDDDGRTSSGAARLHGDSRRHHHQQHHQHRLQRQQQLLGGRVAAKCSPAGVADSMVQQSPHEKLFGARYATDGTNGGGAGGGIPGRGGLAGDGVVVVVGGDGGGRCSKQEEHHRNCVVRNRVAAAPVETHAPAVTTASSTTSTSSSPAPLSSSSTTSSTTSSSTADANHSVSNHVRVRRGSETERELLRQFKVEEGEATTRRRAFCAQYLSMLLLLSTALFFLGLAFVYVNIRTANERQGNATSSTSCYNHSALDDGPEWQILIKLYDHLATIAGDLDCGDHVHIKSRRISFVDAYAFVTSTSPLVNESMFNASLQIIIGSEADLGIRLLGESTEDEVVNLVDVRYLESTHPQRSFICRLRRAFLTVLHKMFVVFAGVGIVLGVLAYMKYRWRKEEEETRNMYDLVERIIEMLRSHSENCLENKSLQPVLPLPHVRDTLIPLQERRRMGRVWRRAVAFIASNESRVCTERQRVAGEDCEVWRWTQAAAAAPPPGKLPTKIWQGKAFHLDRRNSPLHSLTPCLKIRNMFDPDVEIGENWHLSIHDAIMEKCHDNGGIVHIEVDKTSHEGCVYVKCLSPEHAGKAFKSLHGSWFDGKLVTVKYLWLERYHQRFPHAVTSNTPMQPSDRAANAAAAASSASSSSSASSPPSCQVERHGDKTI